MVTKKEASTGVNSDTRVTQLIDSTPEGRYLLFTTAKTLPYGTSFVVRVGPKVTKLRMTPTLFRYQVLKDQSYHNMKTPLQ
jgi:hypothetical protein